MRAMIDLDPIKFKIPAKMAATILVREITTITLIKIQEQTYQDLLRKNHNLLNLPQALLINIAIILPILFIKSAKNIEGQINNQL